MGPASARWQFELVQQKLVLDIEPSSKTVKGVSEFYVRPTGEISMLHFHARSIDVAEVYINGASAAFVYNDPGRLQANDQGSGSAANIRQFSAKQTETNKNQDKAELQIQIPESIPIQQTDDFEEEPPEDAWQPEDEDEERVKGPPVPKYEILHVQISFSMKEPFGCAQFLEPRFIRTNKSVIFCAQNTRDSARYWFPCLDTLVDPCTWEIEVSVPEDYIVISNGKLAEQFYNDDETKITFYYQLAHPTLARNISIVAGVFEILPDPKVKEITHFCMEGSGRDLLYTVSCCHDAWTFFTSFLGLAFPYDSLKLCFIDNPNIAYCVSASVATFSSDFIHDQRNLEKQQEVRRMIAYTIIYQWFGSYIGPKTWGDQWITLGLCEYLVEVFLKKINGEHDFKYALAKDMNTVIGDTKPQSLYQPQSTVSQDIDVKRLIPKARLTFFLIDQMLGRDLMQMILQQLFTLAYGRKDRMSLSSQGFLKLIKRLTNVDFKSFGNTWIFSQQPVHFECKIRYSVKFHNLELKIRQINPPSDSCYTGKLTVRILEYEKTYEHIVHVEKPNQTFEFPIYTKGRRKKREDEIDLDIFGKNDTPILWVRIDPEMEWIRKLEISQPDYFTANQLFKETDTLGQMEAINYLVSSVPVASALTCFSEVLNSAKYPPSGKVEVLRALATLSQKESCDAIVEIIIKFYIKFYFEGSDQVKPNDFSNTWTYLLQKETFHALAICSQNVDSSKQSLFQFYLKAMKENDNSKNIYTDTYLLEAIGNAISVLSFDDSMRVDELVAIAQRQLATEKLFPHQDPAASVGCLRILASLQAQHVIPLDPAPFLEHIGIANHPTIRAAAYECLMYTQPYSSLVRPLVMGVIIKDPDLDLRRKILLSGYHSFFFSKMFSGDVAAEEKTSLYRLLQSQGILDVEFRYVVQGILEKLNGIMSANAYLEKDGRPRPQWMKVQPQVPVSATKAIGANPSNTLNAQEVAGAQRHPAQSLHIKVSSSKPQAAGPSKEGPKLTLKASAKPRRPSDVENAQSSVSSPPVSPPQTAPRSNPPQPISPKGLLSNSAQSHQPPRPKENDTTVTKKRERDATEPESPYVVESMGLGVLKIRLLRADEADPEQDHGRVQPPTKRVAGVAKKEENEVIPSPQMASPAPRTLKLVSNLQRSASSPAVATNESNNLPRVTSASTPDLQATPQPPSQPQSSTPLKLKIRVKSMSFESA